MYIQTRIQFTQLALSARTKCHYIHINYSPKCCITQIKKAPITFAPPVIKKKQFAYLCSHPTTVEETRVCRCALKSTL